MEGTPLSREVLLDKGFEEKTMEGKTVFVKEGVAIVFTTQWMPCRLKTGKLFATNLYVNTWEELVSLIQKGGMV